MLFLEEATFQALAEEGQTIITIEDLGLTWEQVERLFIGTYNQAKIYVPIYKQEVQTFGPKGTIKADYAHVQHIVYNTYQGMAKLSPDIASKYWEFNPYTKEMQTLANTAYSVIYNTYSYCGPLPISQVIGNVQAGVAIGFKVPAIPDETEFVIKDSAGIEARIDINTLVEEEDEAGNVSKFYDITGPLGVGKINVVNLTGFIVPNSSGSLTLDMKSKYSGILELDLTCELFFTWYKAVLLGMIGGMKEQINLDGVGLPFNITQDGLLARSRELLAQVEQLKASKSHWSQF